MSGPSARDAPPVPPQSQSSPDEIVVAIPEEAPGGSGSADNGEPSECVICLGEMGADGDPTRTLVCGHTFHISCVEEWLSKDGRCPTCRHQIQEVTRPLPTVTALPEGFASRTSMQSMAILMLESRRLMMLSTMEAALAVLVTSYVTDPYLLSPALMIIAAATTFVGASNYLAKSIAAARPVLALNGLYHVYLIAGIVHAQQGVAFISDDYGSARTVIFSLGCVTVMEVATLKKASSFHQRLIRASQAELRTLRHSRRDHVSWAQRLIVLVMFVLICAPVIARYVCGGADGRDDGTCD